MKAIEQWLHELRAVSAKSTGKSMLLGVAAMLLADGSSYAYHQAPDDIGHNRPSTVPNKAVIIGKASWYGRAAAGQKTATGERLNPQKFTAACRQLPLQSRAVVTNLENKRSVDVRINDCGPYTKGRQIDVSKAAAEKLAMVDSGTARVKVQSIAAPSRPVYCANRKLKTMQPYPRRSNDRRRVN